MFIGAILAAGIAAAQLEPGAVVGGTITNQVTGGPVRKAEVVLSRVDVRPNERRAPLRMRTDEQGRYLFPDVPSGHYRVLANAEGFEQVAYGARSSEQPGRLLLLGPNETMLDANVALRPTGVVTGTVLDQNGDPVKNAQVSLLQSMYQRGKPLYIPAAQGQTDDRGRYRVFGIRAGRYRVMAAAQVPQSFGAMFYPNAARFADATVLHITPGKEFPGIDFRLAPVGAVRVKGRVTAPANIGQEAPVSLQFIRSDLPGQFQHNSGMSLAGPAYSFVREDLQPGHYLIAAELRQGNRIYRASEEMDIGVGGNENLVLTLEPPVTLKGQIRFEGATPAKPEVRLMPGGNLPFGGEQPVAVIQPDGSFTIADVPAGPWDIDVPSIPRGGYLKSMMLGDKDVLIDDMQVTGRTDQPLKIVVGAKAASLKGEVDIPQTYVGLEAAVLLAPEGRFRGVHTYYTLKGINPEGEFQMDGITPGSYRVYAFSELNYRSYQDPEFLKQLTDKGVAVEFKEGEAVVLPKRVPLILPGVISLE